MAYGYDPFTGSGGGIQARGWWNAMNSRDPGFVQTPYTPPASTVPAAPVLGGVHGAGSEPYGYRPLVPDPMASAHRAIGGNYQNLGDLYKLAGGLNQFNQQQLIDQLIAGLPGYQANIGQASANTASNLRGQIPPDVIAQMQIRAAERGIGAPGPNANAAYLAAIGRSSLDLQNLGEQQLTAQIGRTPKAPLFDPSSMFVTPDQIQQANAAANLYASSPNPAAAAAERLRIAQTAGLPRGAGPIGGFMGVANRGGGPMTPYDRPASLNTTLGPYYGGGGYQTPPAAPWSSGWTPGSLSGSTAGDTTRGSTFFGSPVNAQQPAPAGNWSDVDQGFESSEYPFTPPTSQPPPYDPNIGSGYDQDYLRSIYFPDLTPEEQYYLSGGG